MGTHPIFESDFDCLTETLNRWVNWDKNESGFQSWKTEI